MTDTNQIELNQIRKKMSNDSGLNRIGKQITYTALVCLAIAFSGATINKANTFLFEISFNNPKGLSILLVLVILLLLIRYHGFASAYFAKLSYLSNARFENNPLIIDRGNPAGYLHGVIGEFIEGFSGPNYPRVKLKWKLPLKMCLKVTEIDPTGDETGFYIKDLDELSIRDKLAIAWCIVLTKIKNFTNHPDHLNLLAPYFIGITAITMMLVSFVKPELIQIITFSA